MVYFADGNYSAWAVLGVVRRWSLVIVVLILAQNTYWDSSYGINKSFVLRLLEEAV